MLSLEFVHCRAVPHSLLGVMAELELLTPMVASYLLNVERVRVAPTLNGASVIRIEPPLIITDAQIDRVIEAVENTVAMLAQRNTAAFLGHLVGYGFSLNQATPKAEEVVKVEPRPEDGRFAFLVHPVDLHNYTEFDASLGSLSPEQLADLSSRWNDMVEPFVVSSSRIVDHLGQSAYGDFICVPKTAQQLLADPEGALQEIASAVQLAAERGAKIVGLGAYTSVVTMGGRQLLPHTKVALTTGNSYVWRLARSAKRLEIDVHCATGVVVGAGSYRQGPCTASSEQAQKFWWEPARPKRVSTYAR